MASYLLLAAIVQAILFQATSAQCINSIVSNCGLETFLPIEQLIPNQFIIPAGLPLNLPAVPNCSPYQIIPSLPPALPEAVAYAPTVIQDSSVANNLANTLQLLVVSNLLSSTLPGGYEPGYYAEPYLPIGPLCPYNYIY